MRKLREKIEWKYKERNLTRNVREVQWEIWESERVKKVEWELGKEGSGNIK